MLSNRGGVAIGKIKNYGHHGGELKTVATRGRITEVGQPFWVR